MSLKGIELGLDAEGETISKYIPPGHYHAKCNGIEFKKGKQTASFTIVVQFNVCNDDKNEVYVRFCLKDKNGESIGWQNKTLKQFLFRTNKLSTQELENFTFPMQPNQGIGDFTKIIGAEMILKAQDKQIEAKKKKGEPKDGVKKLITITEIVTDASRPYNNQNVDPSTGLLIDYHPKQGHLRPKPINVVDDSKLAEAALDGVKQASKSKRKRIVEHEAEDADDEGEESEEEEGEDPPPLEREAPKTPPPKPAKSAKNPAKKGKAVKKLF